jgi:hypothetical protein
MAVDLNSVTIEPAIKERIAKLADVSGGPKSTTHQQPDAPDARELDTLCLEGETDRIVRPGGAQVSHESISKLYVMKDELGRCELPPRLCSRSAARRPHPPSKVPLPGTDARFFPCSQRPLLYCTQRNT